MDLATLASVDFAESGGPCATLGAGWSHPETGFRWSLDSESTIMLRPASLAEELTLRVAVAPHNQPPGAPDQTLTVIVNGQDVGSATVSRPGDFDFAIPAALAAQRTPIELRLRHPRVFVPSEHGPSRDNRRLALAFYRCSLLGAAQPGAAAGPADDDGLVPEAGQLFDGTTTLEQFRSLGEGFVRIILAGRAGLRPHHRVLDLGSGNGQKARALTRFLDARGSYEGLDVVADGIEWCRTRYARFPNFRFQHADVYSSHYNPQSRVADTEYRLPYADGEFDVVFLTSVFTHMLPDGIANYTGEIGRVLKPGGRCVATLFLLNADSTARIIAGGSAIAFVEVPGGFRVMDPKNPSQAVAVSEEWARGTFTAAGLKVAEITFGTWSGGPDILAAFQDLVIAVKP